MCIVPKMCNDMMNVGRLQGFDVRNCIVFVCTKLCYTVFSSLDLISLFGLFLFIGKDCGSGPPSPTGHVHGVGPRGRSPRPDEGEESVLI